MEVVNAYLSDGRLRVLRRDASGELVEQQHRPEYSLFIRTADLGKCERALRSTSRVKTIRNEGEFVRIVCRDYDSRDRLVHGTVEKKQGWFEAHGVATYEADLNPARRYLIDSGVQIQKPLAGYLDLEWDSRVPFMNKGRARMLCWALTLWNGERVGGVLAEDTDEAESELILDLFYELAYVDQVLAWNGERADFEYLQERIKKLGLEIDWRRWLWLDHMELFRKLNVTASESGDEKASMALARVAESLDVQGKLEGVAGKHTWQWWEAGGEKRERLLLYCVEDTATMFRIEAKTGYVSILATLAQTCGVFPDSRGMRGISFVESYLMRLGASRGMRAPTKHYFGDEEQEQFRGAFVFPTGRRGLIRDVHVCDFTRLYPSIMQAWNMSPETHVPIDAPARTKLSGILYRLKDGTAEGALPDRKLDKYQVARLRAEVAQINMQHFGERPEGVACAPLTLEHFRLEPRGLFALALDDVTEQRAYWSKLKASLDPDSSEWKEADRKDNAYKIIANTFYGVSGSPFSRYYLREVSESVTQVGVWLIQATVEEGLRRGMSLIFGDTDSGGFEGCTEEEFRAFVDYCNSTLYPTMLDPTGADKKRISLAFEKSFSLMINIEKKCYAGRLKHFKGKVAKDSTKPVIKGLEYKRGDSAKLARSLQQEIVESLLYIGKPLPIDNLMGVLELEEIVGRWQRHILEKGFAFEHAVIAQAMKNKIEEYGQERSDGTRPPIPRHVQIAKILAERGEAIYPGVKIEFVVVDGKSTPQKCRPASDCTIDDLDLYHLWESTVWPSASRVLEACFPDHLWARWGCVRPTKGVLPGQVGFGFGERRVLV